MSERTPSSDPQPSEQQDAAKPQPPQTPDVVTEDNEPSEADTKAEADPKPSASKAATAAPDKPGAEKPSTKPSKGKPSNNSSAEKAQRTGPHPLSWINLVLMLGLFAVAGYGAWLGWQQQQQTTSELAVLKDRLQQAQQQSGAIQQQEQQLKQQTGQLLADISRLSQQIDSNSDRLAKLPGAERQDWLLAEAEYLLRLANQRLQLERDWSGALSMLQAADNVLLESRNPRLNPVRQTLANEIQTLRAVPALDSVGAVYRLQSLQQSLQDLPWLPEKLKRPQAQAVQAEAEEPLAWYWQLWNNISNALSTMVRLRERDVAMEAPLTPDQFYYLQQNMHLMLEQAQVALMRQEPALYQHSLQRVQQWLDQYLMAEDDRSRAVRSTLKELQQWQVAPDAPDISASLLQLQQLVEQQRRGSVTPRQPEPVVQEPAA